MARMARTPMRLLWLVDPGGDFPPSQQLLPSASPANSAAGFFSSFAGATTKTPDTLQAERVRRWFVAARDWLLIAAGRRGLGWALATAGAALAAFAAAAAGHWRIVVVGGHGIVALLRLAVVVPALVVRAVVGVAAVAGTPAAVGGPLRTRIGPRGEALVLAAGL